VSDTTATPSAHAADTAPGDERRTEEEIAPGLRGYCIGFVLAAVLTAASFAVAGAQIVWRPAVSIALIVLAIAQMGVHLVFFLHITTAPDNKNNALALAFGVLIVLLLIGGSLWIMANLNHHMMPIDQIMKMQR
jgi:cytochrome o ubiquinol oxidase subunit IV